MVLDISTLLASAGAVTQALTQEGISCNVLAAFHHDHLLVPANRVDAAIAALRRLAASGTSDDVRPGTR